MKENYYASLWRNIFDLYLIDVVCVAGLFGCGNRDLRA
jgi:hypothetical protein